MQEPYYIENTIQKFLKETKSKYEGQEADFDKALDEKLPTTIENIVKSTLEELYEYCISDDSDLKNREKEIYSKISENYKIGIRLFEAFIELNTQISSMTYGKYFKLFDTFDDHIKLDTLIAIHVRACQVANEILVLIKNGYADGAHARWRTLHELSVTFLYLYDSDYEVIHMYNDYEIIEKYKKAKEYKACENSLDLEDLEDDVWEELSKKRDEIIEQYGKDFSEGYGWTMKDLPKGRRNFRELEKHVGAEKLRIIYSWANESVHAGVSGIKHKLSLREEESYHFLTGSNDCGFLDPVQYTSNSLCQMSEVLLGMEDSILHKIFDELLFYFQNEIVLEFSKVEGHE
ncbi:hypothetical protein BAX97_11225 [Elizabethkingia meningoseptica]|uniref:DUF5677 domain-containing protein n=1 Tax=Elizabethkingia meningoseptica TaxID=238 RepID=UPI00093663A1|nr:DUF5677 domain-containing protein [Elizabethkingia meningoseptica]MDE5487285.1 hypothetical protein [Elizabethkingia meningoseptica]MVW93717.1 hypothetical protein [Elizabethkingia meningoseptica]OPC35452.1 hypothetical protein BAX97_11225 [Elizabethkingia meningoseptica]